MHLAKSLALRSLAINIKGALIGTFENIVDIALEVAKSVIILRSSGHVTGTILSDEQGSVVFFI